MILDHFHDSEIAWKADLSQLIASGIGEKLAQKFTNERNSINPNKEWALIEKENIRVLTIDDEYYPKLLKEISRPPHILYMRGNLNFNHYPSISIVGSRKFTPYGEQVAAQLANDLARAGFIIISGLAIGIDAIAHRSTLDCKGKTVAVLGSSPDNENIFPRANFRLSQEIIASGGAILSEYPPKTPATQMTFPARNRIIAGMSLGTIVIEASEKSGALITANYALESNRQVFSVPGSIFSPASEGTNNLIKKGAKLVSSVGDILEEFSFSPIPEKNEIIKKNPENEEEKLILNSLSSSPTHIDNIAKITKLETAVVASSLSIMEIKGWVKNIGGQNYIII